MNRKKDRKRAERPQAGSRRGNAGAGAPPLEGNSKITNERITLPPGFLAKGFRSRTVKKLGENENIYSDERCILEEDLKGLIKPHCKSVRRSKRISSRNLNESNEGSNCVAQYLRRLLNSEKTPLNSLKIDGEGCSESNNQCRSIFKEINEKFERNSNFNEGRTLVDYNSNFCKNLKKKIRARFKRNSLVEAGLKITQEISKINQILSGKLQPNMETSPPLQNAFLDDSYEKKNFKFVPKTEWVFQTPPRQRIVIPKADGCQIQPAVICTSKKSLNIYEIKPKVNVDLKKFENTNIPIDSRFLKRVDSFQARPGCSTIVEDQNICYMESENFADNNAVDITFENPFFKCMTARPEKTVKKMSKIAQMHKQNSLTTNFESTTDFHKDFNFIDVNKDWTSPVFVDYSKGKSSEFKRQLFTEDSPPDDGKIFKFPKQPKLFDFSKK